jgi:nucleoside-diphosphate-sugar epimerase
MRDLKIPKGVYTSTVAIFSDTHGKIVDETYRYEGPHLSEYDRTKAIAHYEVAEPMMRAELPLVIVMPGLVYGPGDTSPIGRLLANYLDGRLPLIPKDTAYVWAHVEDVARGHMLALTRGKPGESYIIAGEPYSLVDAMALLRRSPESRRPGCTRRQVCCGLLPG